MARVEWSLKPLTYLGWSGLVQNFQYVHQWKLNSDIKLKDA